MRQIKCIQCGKLFDETPEAVFEHATSCPKNPLYPLETETLRTRIAVLEHQVARLMRAHPELDL